MATMVAPDQTDAQRFAALEAANVVRLGRAALKADLRHLTYAEGRERVAQLIERPPAFIHSMKVRDLLLAIPRMGESKADWILNEEHISARRTVGALPARQRRAVAEMLRTTPWVMRLEERLERSAIQRERQERNEQILAWRREGLPNVMIAARLGCTPKAVSSVLMRMRDEGVSVPLLRRPASREAA